MKAEYYTVTKISEYGMYEIIQILPGEADQVVALSPYQMKRLISDMQTYLADTSWHDAKDED